MDACGACPCPLPLAQAQVLITLHNLRPYIMLWCL